MDFPAIFNNSPSEFSYDFWVICRIDGSGTEYTPEGVILFVNVGAEKRIVLSAN